VQLLTPSNRRDLNEDEYYYRISTKEVENIIYNKPTRCNSGSIVVIKDYNLMFF